MLKMISYNNYQSNVNVGNKISPLTQIANSRPWCDKQWRNFTNFNGVGEIVKRIILFVPLILASLIVYPVSFFSPKKAENPLFAGNGISVIQPYEFEKHKINEVVFPFLGNLTVKKGNSNTLTLNTEDNLIDQFTPHIEGSKLVLNWKPGTYQFHNLPDFVLTVPTLHKLVISGSGNAVIDEITGDSFSCRISGKGNVKVLQGTVNHQKVTISGKGEYLAPNFQGINSQIRISGLGKAIIQVKDALKVDLSGNGTCEYFGNPSEKSIDVSGNGTVTHNK